MIKSVGIIGFGQMGKILADIFSARFNVLVFDTNPPKNLKINNLKEVASADLVIFCVALEDLKISLKKASPFIKNESIVLDITSLKEKPLKLMQKLLPSKVSILGTHPMFGPNSLSRTSVKNIVFCPARISAEKLQEIERIFNQLGFNVFKMRAKKHDQMMARSQLVAHLFAQLTKDLKIREFSFAPESFRLMLKAFEMADPSEEFLHSMIRNNKFSLKTITEIQTRIEKYLMQFNDLNH